MKLRSGLLGLMGVILLSSLPQAAFADPIQDFIDQPISAKANGQKFTLDEVQAIIIKACTARKWTPRVVEPGKLSANILVRGKHFAEVSIPFDASNYSILYSTSRELDANEKKRKIDGHYNKWVSTLNADIGRAFVQAINSP